MMKLYTILLGLLLLSTIPLLFTLQPMQTHDIYPNQPTQVLIQVYSPKISLQLEKTSDVKFSLTYINIRTNKTIELTSANITGSHEIIIKKPGLYQIIFNTDLFNSVEITFKGTFFRNWILFIIAGIGFTGYASYNYVRS